MRCKEYLGRPLNCHKTINITKYEMSQNVRCHETYILQNFKYPKMSQNKKYHKCEMSKCEMSHNQEEKNVICH